MKKQPEITAQTKQNLMDAFWELYCHKRIDKITIKEITTKAGYNRGTFYEYFIDVYDVLEQIEESLLPDLTKELSLDFPLSPSQVGFPMDYFLKYYDNYNKYLTVLLSEHGDPLFIKKLKDKIKPSMLEAMMKNGFENSFEVDFVLDYIITATNGLLYYWFSLKEKPPLEVFMNLAQQIMTQGPMKVMMQIKTQNTQPTHD